MKKSKLKPNDTIPVIVGPTGVGKSEVAYHLALRLKAEILSADAFQVYRYTEIGTAQPPKEWQKKIKHHLIGAREPSDNWNAVEFAKEARNVVNDLDAKKKKLIIIGGAGFYLKALVEGAPAGMAPSPEIRFMVAAKVKELGNKKAHDWLRERDPLAAKRLHPNDTQRICRALEKTHTNTEVIKDFEPLGTTGVKFFGIERSRENLDLILKERSELMWKNGLLNETKKLMNMDIPADHPIWGAIGYAEAAAFLREEMTQAEALEKIYRRTRQYAKRQWTWFKHQHEVHWINLDDYSDILQVVNFLEKKIAQ